MTAPTITVTHPVFCADPAGCEAQRDWDGSLYHGSAFRDVTVNSANDSGPDTVSVSASRVDDPTDGPADPVLHVLLVRVGVDIEMSPGQALGLAEALAEYARLAGGHLLPVAQDVRLGDQVLTPAGWQTVTGLLHDGLRDEVAVFTVSDDDPAARYQVGERVAVRPEATT